MYLSDKDLLARVVSKVLLGSGRINAIELSCDLYDLDVALSIYFSFHFTK